MVKLASARESRMYGTRSFRNRMEYINSGMYLFATIVLVSGFVSEFSKEPKSGLVLLLIGLLIVFFVNVHDLLAHMAGIDCRLGLMEMDLQLALVEFLVPVVQGFGTLVYFLGILLLFVQAEHGYGYFRLEKHALNMLIAGPVLWVLGSIHNSCQIYERADGHVQILQQSVQIPFLMGSVVFMVGGILNRREHAEIVYHGLMLLGKTWVWIGISGGILFFIGGLANVVKVFKMQQIDRLRLEKLRGGAQERLYREREGQVPLIREEHRRRKMAEEEQRWRKMAEDARPASSVPAMTATGHPSTPYKNVLLGQTRTVLQFYQ